MKFFLVTTMFLSLGVFAQAPGAGTQGSGYAPNDGKTPPGTFTSKPGMGEAAPSSSTTTTGVSTQGPQTMGTSESPNSGSTKSRSNVSGPGISSADQQSSNRAEPTTSESGITNSAGVTTDQMNTSPNAAPTTDSEARRDATLSTGETFETGPYTREGTFDPQKPEEIEAQEESPLDYSTTPKKRTTTPMGPNKK